MNPGRYNTNVVIGTTFSLIITWKIGGVAVDLTGYTADLQVRDVSNNLITEMSTANGRAVITASSGKVSCTLSAALSAALTAGTYTYGLNVTAPDSTVTQLLSGVFVVTTTAVQ